MFSVNLFLFRLPETERDIITRLGRRVRHRSGETLYPTGGPIFNTYFPETSVSSLVTEMEDGRSVEAATVGREGIIGFSALWGVRQSSHLVLIQVPGESLEVPVEPLVDASPSLPALNARVARYAEAVMFMMSQSAACLALHPVQERCARWLLTTADRTGKTSFELTQEFLATMLGVHRPTVTIAMGHLQKAGLIETHRGVIDIVDVDHLKRASCECYERVQAAFEQLLG